MFKRNQVLLAVGLVGGFLVVATASILADVGMQEDGFAAASSQVDSLELSSAGRKAAVEPAR